MEYVVLVDTNDIAIGEMEKMEAHQEPILHRAFSVFIFNRIGQMLLQQRAINKYHSGGLWTNSCCSHPRPGEDTLKAASRRLQEEMGFNTPIRKVFDFVYQSSFENGLTEYEFDHVFVGEYDGEILPDSNEVADYAYYSMEEIRSMILQTPGKFTAWFHIAFPKVWDWWEKGRTQ